MIGEEIARIRRDRALSQVDLALRAGISEAALVRIEGGIARPRLSTLRKLADALAVSVSELTEHLRGDAPPGSEEEVSPIAQLQSEASRPLATLRARDALQRVAEDVVVGLAWQDPRVVKTLDSLASLADELPGALADQGFALAAFLRAIRMEKISPCDEPDAQATAATVRRLFAVVTEASDDLVGERLDLSPQRIWVEPFQQVNRKYAMLLLGGEPRQFHEAVGGFLLEDAALAMADMKRRQPETVGRRAVKALRTVLSQFDFANGTAGAGLGAVRKRKETLVGVGHLG